MKASKSLIAISLALSTAIFPSAIAAERTSIRSAGPSQTTVINTIRSGAGVPSKALGNNGDFYIDTKSLNLYGPKTKGVWKMTTSLRPKEAAVVAPIVGASGAEGAAGATGSQGDKGDKGDKGSQGDKGATGDKGAAGSTGSTGARGETGLIGAIGLTGAVGATGSQGTIGLTGPVGAPGLQGDRGTTGLSGATGATGATGAKGDAGTTGAVGATGATGAKGDTGNTGAAGATGATGAKGDLGNTGAAGAQGAQGVIGADGLKGDTGTAGGQGAAGISYAKFAALPIATLAITSAGSTTTQLFFEASQSGHYTFQVIVTGIASTSDFFKLSAVIVIGSTPITDQFAITSDANTNANGISGRQYGFTVIGAQADVSIGTVFGLRITNQIAVPTGVSINFMGRALVNKVGSIG